jgi:hypothetical protein
MQISGISFDLTDLALLELYWRNVLKVKLQVSDLRIKQQPQMPRLVAWVFLKSRQLGQKNIQFCSQVAYQVKQGENILIFMLNLNKNNHFE